MTLSELFDKADEQVSKRFAYSNATINEMNEYRDGYIHGMTEKLEGMIPIEKARQWFNLHFRQVGTPKEIKHDFESKERMWKSFTQFMEK